MPTPTNSTPTDGRFIPPACSASLSPETDKEAERTIKGYDAVFADFARKMERERNAAIQMLAEWCNAVEHNGTGWDDWDEHYKDARWRPCIIRELIDAKLAELENVPCGLCGGRGEIGGITASEPGGCSEPCPECNPQNANPELPQ